VLGLLSSPDGEQFFGDQEQYFDELDQQNYFDPGKYNMGSPCCPIHFNHINSYCMCLPWVAIKDFLIFDLYLVTYGDLHWVALLVLI
jgi:hypothetical protein